MKVYMCDSCGAMAKSPYAMGVTRFYYESDYEIYGVVPRKAKRELKIHLCAACCEGLKTIGEKALAERSEEK